jgi:MFS transporter, PAT family, beta-lactamase induction signal transducer AmpG
VTRAPHPAVWTLLYFPFGALGGFVSVALTFLATRHGLSITEGALLGGAQLLSQWLKWSWAPLVDVTLTPKRWYVLATASSALGVLAMSAIPLSPERLWLLLAVIAVASLVNSVVGMAIEAIMAAVTPPDQRGRTSAWFQAGNLGGYGVGGGVGLLLVQHLPAPWMAGALMGISFLLCNLGLLALPDVRSEHAGRNVLTAFVSVLGDIRALAGTRGGLLSAWLCFLPIGTGAAQASLTQAAVAGYWGAGDTEVALLQGVVAGFVTAIGCFAGGWLSDRMPPRHAYALIGAGLAAVAVGMAVSPATVTMYVVWNLVYSFGVGLAYAAFTAVVLDAIGASSAATKYNLFASLSNFPIWWLGLVLGRTADLYGPRAMLLTEAGLAVAGIAVFFAAQQGIRRITLPDRLPTPPSPA